MTTTMRKILGDKAEEFEKINKETMLNIMEQKGIPINDRSGILEKCIYNLLDREMADNEIKRNDAFCESVRNEAKRIVECDDY